MGRLILPFVLLSGLVATPAMARNICFAENQCDFRGFACVSEVESCQGSLAATKRDYKRLARDNRNLKGELTKARRQAAAARATKVNAAAEMERFKEEELIWMRERDAVVGDYTRFMLCVRNAETLDGAKACFDE